VSQTKSSGSELSRALAKARSRSIMTRSESTRSVRQTDSIGASSGAELARAFAKVTNGSKRIGQTDSSGAELARALAKARYSSKVMPPNELAAAAAKIKTKKSKRTKTARKEKFSARDFDYCMDDDGTIIWTEGPIDTATGAQLVCHPTTGQLFRLEDLDEYGGLIPTSEPVFLRKTNYR